MIPIFIQIDSQPRKRIQLKDHDLKTVKAYCASHGLVYKYGSLAPFNRALLIVTSTKETK
jgi:hypothetical protein